MHITTPVEIITRLSCFFGALIILGIWEVIAPKRKWSASKLKRWLSNLSIVAINTAIIRLFFPAAAVGVALFAAQQKWGLLNHYSLPYWFSVLISVVILDLVIYIQHVIFHAIPIFWRVHRVHHVDLDFDVTTGVRFHPIEIVLSLFIKFAAIILLGAPALGVIIFEILLNVVVMFNHGNIRMPLFIDRVIRWVIVTPDMHRVHHSMEVDETNSNFGFSFSIWDRVFGTYRRQPRAGHVAMTIGIKSIRDHKFCVDLLGMLWLPFVGKVSDYVINRKMKE